MKGGAMEKPKGRLPSSLLKTDEGYVNPKIRNDIHMMYERKGRGREPWYLGVVEYQGQFYNLDDPYDQYRVALALYFNGVIRKKRDDYTIIHPSAPELDELCEKVPKMKLATLVVNLQVRLFRVLNEHELNNYNSNR
jgi:hypothetical protein